MTTTPDSRIIQSVTMVALFAFGASACGGQEPLVPDPEAGEWQLVWADEFDVAGLPDSTKWSYDVGGHGWGNRELQYYTERRPENARVEGGRLIIEARRDFYEGHEYTSARLVTKGKADWTYGRFEVRARLPSGRGTWPAAWMLASQHSYGLAYWPDNGEIDIMEHVGYDPDVVHAAVHTRAYHHSIGTHRTASTLVPGARSDFHLYAIEWSNEEIRAYVDDVHYFTFRNERLDRADADYRHWPFDRPFHLLLNVAVGGNWGGAQGVDPNIWPQRMEVEYVRVYQRGQ
jgi:beta-glucanase (GH16 family)